MMVGSASSLKLFRNSLLAVAFLYPCVYATTPASGKLPAKKRNVILITVDTLRADHVHYYGASGVQTPTLDALCRDGIVFERAFSQVPLTWPSHAAILTGTYPFQNGVQDFTGQPLSPQFHSVAEVFKRHGYATGAVVSAFVLDRSWGLSRGFDFYDDEFSAEAFKQKEVGLVDRKAGESVTHAIGWLKKTSHSPFFLWLHLYDPHSPYDPPEPYFSQYKGHLYDGEIAYADHELERLMAWLKANRLYENSAIVFLSDHGESLGEHGEGEHGFFVYNATIRVPLVVKPPSGSGFRPRREAGPVETIAVAETLVQLAGLKDEIEKQFQAPSLLGRDQETDRPVYSESFYPFSSFGWSPLHSLETSRYQYIDAPAPELYDISADPEEKTNLAAKQPATVAVLKKKLKDFLASNPFVPETSSAANLSPDAQEKLRALGYFGFRAAVSPEALNSGLADPKDKLSEFNAILKAQDAFQRNDDDQAEALLGPVQESDPKMYVIPFMLGESALRRQNWRRAADQLQRCLELNPNFDNAMTGMALALSKLGHVEEAKGWLEKAVRSNPQNYRAWYEIALMESDPAAALGDYEKAISIQPNFGPGQRDLGLALFRANNYGEAAHHLEKAIALGLNDAHMRNFLGICYSRTNRVQKSIASYEEALKLDATLAEAHLNLAYELSRAGQGERAQAEYARACRLESKFCGAAPK